MQTTLLFPDIDPILIQIGPLAIRWYALAYLVGIVLGIFYGHLIAQNNKLWTPNYKVKKTLEKPNKETLEDLGFFIILGIILGGRLGYILFYNTSIIWQDPIEIFKVWHGGMAFHGGLIGVILAVFYTSYKHKISIFRLSDLIAPVVPIGLFLGRIANFINAELYGRATRVPWAIIFPSDPLEIPRHPSQLYEAFLEGILLFILLNIAIYRFKALTRPGLVTGLFLGIYGLFRILVEPVRLSDSQMPYFLQGEPFTMGILLSLPMIAYGTYLFIKAVSNPSVGFKELKPKQVK